MSSKAQSALHKFNSLPQVKQLAVFATIARTVTPLDHGLLSDVYLAAIAAGPFALLDHIEAV